MAAVIEAMRALSGGSVDGAGVERGAESGISGEGGDGEGVGSKLERGREAGGVEERGGGGHWGGCGDGVGGDGLEDRVGCGESDNHASVARADGARD